jgi:hypothetical protein
MRIGRHIRIQRAAFRAGALCLCAAMLAACAGGGSSQNSSANGAGASNVPGPASTDVLVVSPAPQTSFAPSSDTLLAPQPGNAYALILGPATIDDGVGQPVSDTGKAVAKAANAVTDLFGNSNAPATSYPPTVAAARDLDAKIPVSEYNLTELAKTLPNDPIAIYHFVTDKIAVDDYDGVMRGPLVTWMSRAGSPTDKITLLAWLFVTKGIPYQFVRGTLSPDERARIAQASATVPGAAPSVDPAVAAYVGTRIKDGAAFAGWASGLLKGKNIALGSAGSPGDRLSVRHYWIQIDRDGKLLDLDPTLPGTAEGTHLGAIDSAFKPWAALPNEEWHYMQVRVLASYADNSSKTLLQHVDTVPNLAYTPIRVVFAPAGKGVDPTKPGSATAFDAGLKIGAGAPDTAHVDLGNGSNALRSVTLEIRRKGPDGNTIAVARRTLLDPGVAVADRPYRLAGMTTILTAPGRGANAFTTHEQIGALAQLAQDVADAKAGKTPEPHAWYPIRIADFFARDDAVADALGSSAGVRLYRDRPNVAMQRTWFARGAGSNSAEVNVFDIADNGMGSSGGQSDATVTANLTRGYVDTQIERDVSEAPGPDNTIALFTTANTQNTPATVLTQPVAGDANDPLRAGLDQTFAAGQVAIAPQSPITMSGRPAFGWWAIDPASGNSVGRMSGGVGQEMAEYSVTINTISKAYTLYGQLQAGATCLHAGFASVGCVVAVCASIASYVFGGGTIPALASNYGAGQLANAGCSKSFGGGG